MKLLELLSWGDNRLMARLAVAGVLSGAGSAVLLGLVNMAAEGIADNGVDEVDWLLAGGFIALAVVYFLAEVFLLSNISIQIEQGIDKVRRKLLDQIARADFAQLETFGQARLFDSITQSTQLISQNSHMIGMSFRSLLLIIAVMIYVFWLSTLAFFLIILVIGGGIVIYLKMGKQLGIWFGKLHQTETGLFGKVADLFSGIREVRMWSLRSNTLFDSFSASSQEKEHVTAQTHSLMFRQMIMGMMAFYVLLAVIIFIVPVYADNFGATISKVSTAVLFMIGPISTVVQAMAVLGSAEQAAQRMVTLSQDLDAIAEPIKENGAQLPDTFSQIVFEDVCFTYPNRDPRHGFVLGPLNLAVKKGELIFITGGNGAGKSTLIKLLTALYRPASGAIRFDDIQLGAQNIASFRDKIATVFSDFHLFSKLHGSSEIDPDEADHWLNLFELSHITGIRDGEFISIALSAGQRKRLGLITALLEHRPILVLDEWAADQDPYFRKKFYSEILPEIKARGTTIIAVTHDDHYFDVADRRLHLEAGTLHELDHNDARGRV
ncbi:cyclic peptide export ABC transporter [Thalassospira sp.]|uniref:cyclic peptide export ABC transporter n=1 Tax=Thalassospira sp. TaxID=1912094 RepID=UPI003AA9CC94